MGLFSNLIKQKGKEGIIITSFNEECGACVKSAEAKLPSLSEAYLWYELYACNLGLLMTNQKQYSSLIQGKNMEEYLKPLANRFGEIANACGEKGALFFIYVTNLNKVDGILQSRLTYLKVEGKSAPHDFIDFSSIGFDHEVKEFSDACMRLFRTRKIGEYGNY